jgi:hypothetical protein
MGSGRLEKGVDQVIGRRQKHKARSWSAKGSKALAILKVAELNAQWHALWFPPQPEAHAVAYTPKNLQKESFFEHTSDPATLVSI